MEPPYDALPGVISTTSGYMGEPGKTPAMRRLSSGATGHAEVVQVVYDPKKVSYEKAPRNVLEKRRPHPCETGSSATSAASTGRRSFYHTEEQKRSAEASKGALAKTKPFKDDIVTPVVPAGAFLARRDYHQDFYVQESGEV